MRTFSQSESTRMSSLQGTKSQSAHRHRSHWIQVHTNQYRQVPIVSLVPCSTLPNTVPKHITPDETQRVATQHVFHQHSSSEMMSATIPSQWNVLRPLTLVPAMEQDNARQRHTRSVQSSSCAEGGFFSKAQSAVHGLQPKRVVLQKYRRITSPVVVAAFSLTSKR